MEETQPKIFFLSLSAACLLFFPLPGSAVTHPRLCRAHSSPGSVIMSLGFSVGSTVCPVLVLGGEHIPFCASEKDVKKPLCIHKHISMKQNVIYKPHSCDLAALFLGTLYSWEHCVALIHSMPQCVCVVKLLADVLWGHLLVAKRSAARIQVLFQPWVALQ